MIRRLILSTSVSALALGGMPAQAVEYGTLQAAKSSVAFTSKQMGVAVDGHFKKFNATISFDPAKLQANIQAFVDRILAMKPNSVKGTYVRGVTICATMSPSVRVAA